MKDDLHEDPPESFDIRSKEEEDDTRCFPRTCYHCGAEILVNLRHQTRFPPDDPWNFCGDCLMRIAKNDPEIRDNFRECGYFPY